MPSYSLYADLQVSFQSLTEYRGEDGRWHMPGTDPVEMDPLLFALLHLVRADAGTVHRPVHLTGRGLRYARYLSA